MSCWVSACYACWFHARNVIEYLWLAQCLCLEQSKIRQTSSGRVVFDVIWLIYTFCCFKAGDFVWKPLFSFLFFQSPNIEHTCKDVSTELHYHFLKCTLISKFKFEYPVHNCFNLFATVTWSCTVSSQRRPRVSPFIPLVSTSWWASAINCDWWICSSMTLGHSRNSSQGSAER